MAMASKQMEIRTDSAASAHDSRLVRAPAGSRVFETVYLPGNRTMVVLREDVHKKALAAAKKVMEKHQK